ncbi:DUF421 domain-containing protein [Kushneria phosphatilytica]|uniref:DUF421 domain-containing protein n=1 Tax=Kushneria phosphatilytica TaxID=657387 RepID=UPI0008DA4D56|nr:YetF domain-containing protein [Kushneria phosphatilytica]OHV08756.1 hypothetical protein BH688_12100 [Kushneria phosphatilytica]
MLASTVGMYITALLLARWAGVRSFAEMSAFDIAITIAIGSVIATTIAAADPSLLQGMTALFGLYALQLLVSRLRQRSRRLQAAVDNAPILVMGQGGQLLWKNMAVARVTEDDLRQQLRQANVLDTSRVQAVIIEGTGNVHVLQGHGRELSPQDWVVGNVRDYSGVLRHPDHPEPSLPSRHS